MIVGPGAAVLTTNYALGLHWDGGFLSNYSSISSFESTYYYA